MKTIHTGEMIAQGGREGGVEAPDGGLSVTFGGDGNLTPEHLFAGAYAACFLEALKSQVEKAHLSLEGVTVVGRAHLDDDGRDGRRLHVDLRAAIPGVDRSQAGHLMNLAHQTCPYSKATRGNINVNLSFD